MLRKFSGSKNEIAQVQRIQEGAPDFALRSTGRLARVSDAELVFTELPPGKTLNDKFVFGLYWKGECIGCIDIVKGYPNPETAFLGLLLIAESAQGKGFGARAYRDVEALTREWVGIIKIRLAVLKSNDMALPFWRKMGFVETGERKPYQHEDFQTEAILLEKKLTLSPRSTAQ